MDNTIQYILLTLQNIQVQINLYILLRAWEAGSPLNPPPERRQSTPLDPLAR